MIKRYLITRSITAAEGTQTFWVDAESEADALQKYEEGEGGMYQSEFEVMDLGEPENSGETTFDDYGDFPIEAPNAVMSGAGKK